MGLCATAHGWESLLDRLLAHKELEFLGAYRSNRRLLPSLLRAPVSLSLWIETYMPELAGQNELEILIAGAERIDGAHDGRWYQLVPYLLGKPQLKVRVTLLFANKTNHRKARDWLPPQRAAAERFIPARIEIQTLGEYLDDEKNRRPDLLMLFQPGFENAVRGQGELEARYGWLAPGELSRALEVKIPIGVTAYEQIEFEHERWLLSAFGVHPLGSPVQSQYVIEPRLYSLSGPPTGWASVLWRIDPSSQVRPPADDSPIVKAHRRLSRQGTELLWHTRDVTDGWNVGRRTTLLRADTQEPEPLILLGTSLAVAERSRALLRVDDRGRVAPIEGGARKLPESVLGGYPESPTYLFERVLWGLKAYIEALHVCQSKDTEELEAEVVSEPEVEMCFPKVQSKDLRTAAPLERQVLAVHVGMERDVLPSTSELATVCLAACEAGVALDTLENIALALLQQYPHQAALGRTILQRLAEYGDPQTQVNLAHCLQVGDGGPADLASSQRWALRALSADAATDYIKGWACALISSNLREDNNIPDALKRMEEGVTYGSGTCAFALATYWDDGPHRADDAIHAPEPARAAAYYRQAIALGVDKAMLNLGLLLGRHHDAFAKQEEEGDGLFWITRAAEEGDELAMRILESLPVKGRRSGATRG